MIYECNKCGFKVPADKVGEALMHAHLKEHNLGRITNTNRTESTCQSTQ